MARTVMQCLVAASTSCARVSLVSLSLVLICYSRRPSFQPARAACGLNPATPTPSTWQQLVSSRVSRPMETHSFVRASAPSLSRSSTRWFTKAPTTRKRLLSGCSCWHVSSPGTSVQAQNCALAATSHSCSPVLGDYSRQCSSVGTRSELSWVNSNPLPISSQQSGVLLLRMGHNAAYLRKRAPLAGEFRFQGFWQTIWPHRLRPSAR